MQGNIQECIKILTLLVNREESTEGEKEAY